MYDSVMADVIRIALFTFHLSRFIITASFAHAHMRTSAHFPLQLLGQVIDESREGFAVIPPEAKADYHEVFLGVHKDDLSQETTGMKATGPETDLVALPRFLYIANIRSSIVECPALDGILHVPRCHPAPPLAFVAVIFYHGIHACHRRHPL